jgi:hypothetical protein
VITAPATLSAAFTVFAALDKDGTYYLTDKQMSYCFVLSYLHYLEQRDLWTSNLPFEA